MVGLDDLKAIFQPKQFYDSVILIQHDHLVRQWNMANRIRSASLWQNV